MKFVLAAVNAKYIHSNPAVYTLSASAKAHGVSVDIAEYTINQQKNEVMKSLFLMQPDVLCISCYIWNISYVEALVAELSKVLPGTEFWLGGPEVSYCAVRMLEKHSGLRGIMKGEGEETFSALALAYEQKGTTDAFFEELKQMEGITWRDREGEIHENPWRPVMDLDKVPFPYEDLKEFSNRIIYYESSRGCPFSCSYCLSSVDKKLRFRSLELVKRELQFFLDHKVPQVKFVDRTFNCRKEHAMEIWKYLAMHDNGITNFHFEIAADLITPEELALFCTMRPGLIQLEIGVQSTNPETIKEIHRKMDFAAVASVVREISRGRNIHQHLDLIAGLPYEDYESFRRSFADVYALKPQQLQLGFLKVLKGSYMAEHTEDYGCRYQESEPYEVLFTRWLSYHEVLKLKSVEEMVEIYYNSGQFPGLLAYAERFYDNMFDFFRELGQYYEALGLEGAAFTRIRRYEILLDFLEEEKKAERKTCEALALMDLYARENLKSRPGFAPDLTAYGEERRRFYQKEEQERTYLKQYEGYQWKQLMRMTHLEKFPVDPDGEKREVWLLFDYRMRDPLTGNASVTEIREIQ